MPRTLAVLSLLTLPALAQDAPASKPAAPRDERAVRLLREALHHMAEAPSLTFTTKEVSKPPIDGMPESKASAEFAMDRAQGTLVTVDDEHLFLSGGRMVVKVSDAEWALRRGYLSEGQTLPFLPDLDALWTLLGKAAASASLGQPGGEGGAQQEIVQLTVTDDLARDFLWAGAVPLPSAMGNFAVFINRAGGGRAPGVKHEVTYEFEVAINPASRLIDRITVKGRTKGGPAAGMVVRAAGGAVQFGGAQQEEDEEEGDEGGAAKKARKKDKNTLTYTLSFKDHGKTKVEVPEGARKALGRG